MQIIYRLSMVLVVLVLSVSSGLGKERPQFWDKHTIAAREKLWLLCDGLVQGGGLPKEYFTEECVRDSIEETKLRLGVQLNPNKLREGVDKVMLPRPVTKAAEESAGQPATEKPIHGLQTKAKEEVSADRASGPDNKQAIENVAIRIGGAETQLAETLKSIAEIRKDVRVINVALGTGNQEGVELRKRVADIEEQLATVSQNNQIRKEVINVSIPQGGQAWFLAASVAGTFVFAMLVIWFVFYRPLRMRIEKVERGPDIQLPADLVGHLVGLEPQTALDIDVHVDGRTYRIGLSKAPNEEIYISGIKGKLETYKPEQIPDAIRYAVIEGKLLGI